jgi:hypothetical protein
MSQNNTIVTITVASTALTMGICCVFMCHCCMAIYVIYIHTCIQSLNRITDNIRERIVQAQDGIIQEGRIVQTDEPTLSYAELDENLCYTCFDSKPNTMLITCGHQGLCSVCAARLWRIDKRCPLCRRGVHGVVLLD